ncbi:MAG: TIGR04282 family arsenosugar biosynthesis glycosyltransferase [Gammaproteobacteria bacterium]|nr:TIGR04282 family arsenosugar biosynthesis glycosyltransferase [Gammaproteobacteria bacterium]
MKPTLIVIFAKAPLPGLAKTRLSPALGHEGSANLAGILLRHTLQETLASSVGDVELCVSPPISNKAWQHINLPCDTLTFSQQGEGDLGTRMARTTARVIKGGSSVILIGTDCPALDSDTLTQAAKALSKNDAVILPTFDGGYALLGLNAYHPSLFEGIAWSTDTVCTSTLARMETLKWNVATLPTLYDIDEPNDLQHLPRSIKNKISQFSTQDNAHA